MKKKAWGWESISPLLCVNPIKSRNHPLIFLFFTLRLLMSFSFYFLLILYHYWMMMTTREERRTLWEEDAITPRDLCISAPFLRKKLPPEDIHPLSQLQYKTAGRWRCVCREHLCWLLSQTTQSRFSFACKSIINRVWRTRASSSVHKSLYKTRGRRSQIRESKTLAFTDLHDRQELQWKNPHHHHALSSRTKEHFLQKVVLLQELSWRTAGKMVSVTHTEEYDSDDNDCAFAMTRESDYIIKGCKGIPLSREEQNEKNRRVTTKTPGPVFSFFCLMTRRIVLFAGMSFSCLTSSFPYSLVTAGLPPENRDWEDIMIIKSCLWVEGDSLPKAGQPSRRQNNEDLTLDIIVFSWQPSKGCFLIPYLSQIFCWQTMNEWPLAIRKCSKLGVAKKTHLIWWFKKCWLPGYG